MMRQSFAERRSVWRPPSPRLMEVFIVISSILRKKKLVFYSSCSLLNVDLLQIPVWLDATFLTCSKGDYKKRGEASTLPNIQQSMFIVLETPGRRVSYFAQSIPDDDQASKAARRVEYSCVQLLLYKKQLHEYTNCVVLTARVKVSSRFRLTLNKRVLCCGWLPRRGSSYASIILGARSSHSTGYVILCSTLKYHRS